MSVETMVITRALQASADPAALPGGLPWRLDGPAGQLILAQLGEEPADGDRVIGWMESPALAADVVTGHNDALRHVQSPEFGAAR